MADADLEAWESLGSYTDGFSPRPGWNKLEQAEEFLVEGDLFLEEQQLGRRQQRRVQSKPRARPGGERRVCGLAKTQRRVRGRCDAVSEQRGAGAAGIRRRRLGASKSFVCVCWQRSRRPTRSAPTAVPPTDAVEWTGPTWAARSAVCAEQLGCRGNGSSRGAERDRSAQSTAVLIGPA